MITDPTEIANTAWWAWHTGITETDDVVSEWLAQGDLALNAVQDSAGADPAGEQPLLGADCIDFKSSDTHVMLYEEAPLAAHADDFILFGMVRMWNIFQAGNNEILSKWRVTGDLKSWFLSVDGATQALKLMVSTDGSTDSNTSTFGTMEAGNWMAFVVRKVGTVVTATLNGETAEVTGASAATIFDSSQPINLCGINGRPSAEGHTARQFQVAHLGYTRTVTDGAFADLTTWLKHERVKWAGPRWNGEELTGPYADPDEAVVETVVFTPSGAGASEGDLATWEYSHHTAIYAYGERLYLAASRGGNGESYSGQVTVVYISDDAGATWDGPYNAFPEQVQNWNVHVGVAEPARIAYPNCWAEYDGSLYLIMALDDYDADGGMAAVGVGLFARTVATDGTLGTLFRITSTAYTPETGHSEIAYDNTLGPPLLAYATIWGTQGGTGSDGGTPEAWSAWRNFNTNYQGQFDVTEPATVKMNASGTHLLRFWRGVGNAFGEDESRLREWAQPSFDSGATWGYINSTDVPDAPAKSAALRLADGRIALVGNPNDTGGVVRGHMYIAISSEDYLTWAVEELTSEPDDDPIYANGLGKTGGPAYPSLTELNGSLFVSYSLQKERLAVSRYTVPALSGDVLGDASTECNPELLALRDAQATAQPTQPLDSTTLLAAEIRRVRNLDTSSANQDTNTKLADNWDGVR